MGQRIFQAVDKMAMWAAAAVSGADLFLTYPDLSQPLAPLHPSTSAGGLAAPLPARSAAGIMAARGMARAPGGRVIPQTESPRSDWPPALVAQRCLLTPLLLLSLGNRFRIIPVTNGSIIHASRNSLEATNDNCK